MHLGLSRFFNYMTLSASRELCMKGQEKSVIFKRIDDLPSLEPVESIGALFENDNLMNMITYDESSFDERQYCLEKYEVDNQPGWKDDVGNIFERLNDESIDNES